VAAEVAGEADATAPLHAARGRGSHLGVGVGADLDVRADDAVELDLGVRLQVHAGARARGYVHRRAIRIEAEAAIGTPPMYWISTIGGALKMVASKSLENVWPAVTLMPIVASRSPCSTALNSDRRAHLNLRSRSSVGRNWMLPPSMVSATSPWLKILVLLKATLSTGNSTSASGCRPWLAAARLALSCSSPWTTASSSAAWHMVTTNEPPFY